MESKLDTNDAQAILDRIAATDLVRKLNGILMDEVPDAPHVAVLATAQLAGMIAGIIKLPIEIVLEIVFDNYQLAVGNVDDLMDMIDAGQTKEEVVKNLADKLGL